MCAKVKFVQYRYSDRGAPLYSGTPAPSSGLVIANFFVYYDFYNRLLILLVKEKMKMFRKKSLLALLLSLCMVVGILPATVFAAGQYVPENPRWSGYGNQVMWDKPANASGSTYLEYEAQLVLNGQVLQTESVEIDRWVFFDSKNITQSKDAYTLKVRARQIYLTGDPDGYYTVWKRDAWGDWAIGGNTGGGEGPTPPMNTASAAGKIMEPSIGKNAAAERNLKRAPITSANGS